MTTAPLASILDEAAQILSPDTYADYCPNGVQVYGTSKNVSTIATAVSSTQQTFEAARDSGAELLLVHHGLFWKSTSQVVDPIMRERLRILFDSGMTLAAYHLPLDGHAKIGNNALLAEALNLDTSGGERFAEHGGGVLGFIGEWSEGLAPEAAASQIAAATEGRPPLILGEGPAVIRRVGVCSGGAAGDIVEAAERGCDLFITGEPSEPTHALARELGVWFAAAGHHATERFGVRALGRTLATTFGVADVFVDSSNPV